MHNVQLDLTLLPCQQQLHSPRKDQPRGETGVKRLALSCRHKYIKTIVPPSCEGCISQTNPLSDLSVVSKARAYRPGRNFHLGRKCFLSGLLGSQRHGLCLDTWSYLTHDEVHALKGSKLWFSRFASVERCQTVNQNSCNRRSVPRIALDRHVTKVKAWLTWSDRLQLAHWNDWKLLKQRFRI